MILDTGKTPATARLQDGCIVTFFNNTIYSTGTINFKDTNGNDRYVITVDTTTQNNRYRALHFTRSFPQSAIDTAPRVVLFTPNVTTASATGITANFLYEVISPQIGKSDDGIYQITFWTNVTDGSTITQNDDGTYSYNQAAVLKFSTDRLGDVDDGSGATKLLCTAMIHWELLSQVGGGVTDTVRRLTPVIQKVIVLAKITGENYATDFSTGGSTGMKIHNHADNNNAGFAYACFSPSAIIRPLSWR